MTPPPEALIRPLFTAHARPLLLYARQWVDGSAAEDVVQEVFLRLSAARHGGQPPASLDDIKDLPLPIDPVTGNRFEYRPAGHTAVLRAPPPPGGYPADGQRYELTFQP